MESIPQQPGLWSRGSYMVKPLRTVRSFWPTPSFSCSGSWTVSLNNLLSTPLLISVVRLMSAYLSPCSPAPFLTRHSESSGRQLFWRFKTRSFTPHSTPCTHMQRAALILLGFPGVAGGLRRFMWSDRTRDRRHRNEWRKMWVKWESAGRDRIDAKWEQYRRRSPRTESTLWVSSLGFHLPPPSDKDKSRVLTQTRPFQCIYNKK